MTYEQHRDRRVELEAELAGEKRRHQEAEALMLQEIDRIKQIEDRLFEDRQLKVGYLRHSCSHREERLCPD